eukprot:scaffold57950_cov30-Tisochrysis_lutea.AAC.4
MRSEKGSALRAGVVELRGVRSVLGVIMRALSVTDEMYLHRPSALDAAISLERKKHGKAGRAVCGGRCG